jgi:16S rRNA (guanine527-N7)-methyltransferase
MVPTSLVRLELGLEQLQWSGNRDLLRAFLAELDTWNPRLGLVSVNSPDDLVVRHVLDSLAAWKYLHSLGLGVPGRTLADLGSGAGFPGLPLALAFPTAVVTLIERMERRANFLDATLLALRLTHVSVQQKTFEEVKDRFDFVTLRAFSPLEPKLVKKLKRLLNPGGYLIAYKGRREVIEGELRALGESGEKAVVVPVEVPFLEEERHLVVFAS